MTPRAKKGLRAWLKPILRPRRRELLQVGYYCIRFSILSTNAHKLATVKQKIRLRESLLLKATATIYHLIFGGVYLVCKKGTEWVGRGGYGGYPHVRTTTLGDRGLTV